MLSDALTKYLVNICLQQVLFMNILNNLIYDIAVILKTGSGFSAVSLSITLCVKLYSLQ
jgi:hypothetical protein